MSGKTQDRRLRALRIVDMVPGICPREFARMMWPHSAGWRRATHAGKERRKVRGGGMWLAGGSLLATLHRAHLLRRVVHEGTRYGYQLSARGAQVIARGSHAVR